MASARLLFGVKVANNYELHSYDPANAASLTRLTNNAASDFEPSWSPSGAQISWTSGTSGPTSGIWIMNADGTGLQGPIIKKGRQGTLAFAGKACSAAGLYKKALAQNAAQQRAAASGAGPAAQNAPQAQRLPAGPL